jgi:hypothetical protein
MDSQSNVVAFGGTDPTIKNGKVSPQVWNEMPITDLASSSRPMKGTSQ